jgi:bacteriocin-like protein
MTTKGKTKSKRREPKDARELAEKELDQVSGGMKQSVIRDNTGHERRYRAKPPS